MRIDHAQLRALAAVIREGSFDRAAQSLNVTPSAISQRVKALEDRIGRLLVKRGTPATATAEGQLLVQLAEQTALLEHDALHRMGLAEDPYTRVDRMDVTTGRRSRVASSLSWPSTATSSESSPISPASCSAYSPHPSV